MQSHAKRLECKLEFERKEASTGEKKPRKVSSHTSKDWMTKFRWEREKPCITRECIYRQAFVRIERISSRPTCVYATAKSLEIWRSSTSKL